MLEKIKDFFYNISDLLLAALIFIIIVVIFVANMGPFFAGSLPDEVFGINISFMKQDDSANKTSLAKKNDPPVKKEEKAPIEKTDDRLNEKTEELNEAEKPEENTGAIENPPEENNAASQNPPVQNNPPAQQTASVTITIPKGADSSKVADILLNGGVISNKDEYLKYLAQNGLDTKLRAGTFTVNPNSGIEDITKTLTGN